MTTSMTKATTSTMERGERAGRPLLTRSGAQLLAERAADIRYRRLAELAPLLVEHERDERHVAEFEQVLAEADQWDAFLASADILVIDAAAFDGRIGLGTRVEVRLIDGSTAWVHPVHPFEAFLDDERISVTSPLGAALQGAQVGDDVVVHAPIGTWTCTVLAVEVGDGPVTGAPRRAKAVGR
ncbi:MAG: GreA/GreB family elongation factor [Actinobacteria bacterium]|nr:GreA/GreB family elongation factor [Actinomycetota bacterium]